MNYSLLEYPSLKANECLLLGLFEDEELPEFAATFNQHHQQIIDRLFSKLNEAGQSVWQADIDGHSLVVLNCGKRKSFQSKNLNKYLKELLSAMIKQRFSSLSVCLPQIADFNANWQIQQMLLLIDAQLYRLTDFKTKNCKIPKLNTVQFYLETGDQSAIKAGKAIAQGIRLTRKLADLPANVCTPSYLGDIASELAKSHDKVTTKVMGLKDLEAMKMGAFIAVTQGSQEEPRFIEINYKGAGDEAPIVLVGKGITFDSGGLSIKPANAMDEMKYDMSGAAAVLGTLKTCALLKLPINVVGLIASAENMPSGTAVKPGDIITSMSGQTVEILNTDAEGRLVLADALTYAERFNPKFVIDIATLTGAIIVALGFSTTGFMTVNEDLAQQILAASKEADDKCWRMPLDECYQDALESPLADMINASFDRSAGSITAACFLSKFTQKYPWAHLDIAGTAWVSGKNRLATGRPLPLLIQLLRHAADSR